MTHASVFSGIGGPEVAAAMLGWDNAFHCEINPFGRKVLDYWFPNSESYEDITKTDFTKWAGRIDVLTGGFPCQPFSYAGKRKGAEDDRYLWPQMLRVINEIRPTWFIGENVAGIRTMVEPGGILDMGCETSLFEEDNDIHRYAAEGMFTIERICQNLESAGYSVQPLIIPACAVGAPHRRDRIFFVAHSDRGADLRGSREDEGKGREERVQERNAVRVADIASDVRGIAPDTYRNRGGEIHEHIQPGFPDGAEPFGNGRERMQVRGNLAGYPLQDLQPQTRWAEFPTISPVHRGNDGIPFDVDRLAISFSKWRTESLKAYGNAIVPQVMYEIFRGIDALTKNDLMPL